MRRGKKERFAGKDDDNRGYQFAITIPSIRNIIFGLLGNYNYCITLGFNLRNLLQKLLDFFENILIPKAESECSKKNGLFY